MNNIAQKNAIMRLNENIGLPYLYPGHIAYETATNISQANLNNTFTQLVDNDLYIENKLANDYAYAIGPKAYSKDAVDAADNGYKTWGSANSYELSILQKIELPLQESLTQAFNTRTYFVVKYSGQLYAGTDDGLVFADEAAGQWRMLQTGACRACWLDEGNNTVVFAFSDGIYHLRLSADSRKRIVKVTKGTIDCTAVYFRPADGLLIAASGSELHIGRYTKYFIAFEDFQSNFETVQMQQCDIYSADLLEVEDNVRANVFSSVDTGAYPYTKSVFAGTSKGIAQLSSVDDFTKYKALPAGCKYTQVAAVDGKVFLGTNVGIAEYDVESGQTEATNVVGLSVTCLAVHAQKMYACAGGKLYVNETGSRDGFTECTLLCNEAEIDDIDKVMFIGYSRAFVFFVVCQDGHVYYGFNYIYKDMTQLVHGFSTLYSVCTSQSKLQMCIAGVKDGVKTVAMLQFSRIKLEESATIDYAQLLKVGSEPLIAVEDDKDILKSIRTSDGKNYIVTKRTIRRLDDSSVSCSFDDDIHDVKYIQSKQAFVILFENQQLSAAALDLGTEGMLPQGLYYIDTMASAMRKYGFTGAYDFAELGDYAFAVTTQPDDSDGQDCDTEHTNDYSGASKYFIAYASIANTGMECGFLQSPATLDTATVSAGIYSTPPALAVKNNAVLVLDKDNSRLSGYMSAKGQQVSLAQTYFNVDVLGDDAKVLHATSWKDCLLVCAYSSISNQHGLFMNKVSSVSRLTARSYMPNYEVFDGHRSKQLVAGNVHKTVVHDGKVYLCTSNGLYAADADQLVSIQETIRLSEVGAGNESFLQILAADVKDVSFAADTIVAAAASGLYVITSKEVYKDVVGSPAVIHDVGQDCIQLTVPASNGEYGQIIVDGSKMTAARYSVVQDAGITSVISAQQQLSVDGLAFCHKYTDGTAGGSEDDFVAAIDSSTGAVSAMYFNGTGSVVDVQQCAVINNAALIASSQYTDEESGYEEIDGRFIIVSDTAGGPTSLSSLYKGSKDASAKIVQLDAANSSSFGSSGPVVAVGSRWRIELGIDGKDYIYQDIYQVSNKKLKQTTFQVFKNGNEYFYSSALPTPVWRDLPTGVNGAAWTKWKVIDSKLYALVGSTLYVVDLNVTGSQLVCKQIQNVSDVMFSYDSAIYFNGDYFLLDSYDSSEAEQIDLFTTLHYSTDFMQKIGSAVVHGAMHIDASQPPDLYTDCYTCFTSKQLEKMVDNSEQTAMKSVVCELDYKSSGKDVFVLAESGAVSAYVLSDGYVDSPVSIASQNAQSLFVNQHTIYLQDATTTVYQLNGLQLDEIAVLSDLLQTQTGRLHFDKLLDLYGAEQTDVPVVGSSSTVACNLVNAALGVRDDYSALYITVQGQPQQVYVQIPAGSYIQFTSMQSSANNSGLQLLIDNDIVSSGKLFALRSSGGSISWLELKQDMTLAATDDYQKTAGGKMLSSILTNCSIDSLDDVICKSKNACFVHGSQSGSEPAWYYTYGNDDAKELDAEFMQSGIEYIDNDIANIQLNDIYEQSDSIVFCTNDGMWKTLRSQHLEFTNDPAFTSVELSGSSLDVIADAEGIDVCSLQYYSQYACIAIVDLGQDGHKIVGISALEDKLSVNSTPVVGSSIDSTYKQIKVSQSSWPTDIYLVDDASGEDQLSIKHGLKTSSIDDKRDAASTVLTANCIDSAEGLTFVLADDNSFRFEAFKKNKTCFKLHNRILDNANVTDFQNIDGNYFAVGYTTLSEHGMTANVGEVDMSQLGTVNQLHAEDNCVGVKSSFKHMPSDTVQQPTYYFSFGSAVYKTSQIDDSASWHEELAMPDGATVNGMHVESPKAIVAATDKGLYYTYSKYTLDNDIKKLTPNDVLDMFYKNIDDIDGLYQSTIGKHIAERHADGNVITRINNEIMDSKFSNIADDWIKYDVDAQPGETIIQNDLLHDIKFGEVNLAEEKIDDTIKVDTYNPVCKQDNAPLNYIMKRWMSGYTELYINIPSTGTYYLNHVLGTPNCTTNPNQLLERKNLGQLSTLTHAQKKQNSQVSVHCTYIDVALEAAEYSIDELLEVTIHGNSLPLKIYRDNLEQHYDNVSSRLYQSMVLPSVVTHTSNKPSDSGYYNFQFACFGTDAQAIKISFNDYVNRYGAKFFTIEFNSNNGAGKMQSQKVALDAEVKLKKNIHIYKDQSAFLGWSLKAEVDGMAMPMFLDGQTISRKILESKVQNLKIKSGSTVTLFAVWQGYEPIDDECTELIVKCTDDNKSMTAVDHCVFVDDANPPDTLVVDYGDDE